MNITITTLAPQPTTNEDRLREMQNALGDTSIQVAQLLEDQLEDLGEINLSDADEFCDFKGWRWNRFIREISENADEFHEFCAQSRKYSRGYAMTGGF